MPSAATWECATAASWRWPTHTLLRGRLVFDGTQVVGAPSGRYVKRPVGRYTASP